MTPRRIALLSYGSRGDVAPFVALAVGLRAAGHRVEVAGPEAFAPLAAAHGVPFRPLPGDPEALARSLSDRAGLNLPLQVLRMTQHVLPIAAEVLRVVLEAAHKADVLVTSFLMAEAGQLAAVRSGIPHLSAQLFPIFVPTGEFAAVAYPDLPLGPGYRRLTHHFNNLIFRFGGRAMYALVRARRRDLPALSSWPFSSSGGSPVPILFGYSPSVLAPPPDWPDWATVTGYWSLPEPPGWSPPEDLARFLAAGAPPVYFGVGSMRPSGLSRAIKATAEATRAAGLRAVVAGSPGLQGFAADSHVCLAGTVPHSWLFPRMAAVIHHGGAGTTGSALAAGIPSMAVPITADQAFWGRRLQRLGVGPAPVPLKRWTTEAASEAITALVSEPGFAARARGLGERLGAEDGLALAVARIEDQFDRRQ